METAIFIHKDQEVCPSTPIICKVVENPKRKNSAAGARFESYMESETVADYLEASGDRHGLADLKYDLSKGFFELSAE